MMYLSNAIRSHHFRHNSSISKIALSTASSSSLAISLASGQHYRHSSSLPSISHHTHKPSPSLTSSSSLVREYNINRIILPSLSQIEQKRSFSDVSRRGGISLRRRSNSNNNNNNSNSSEESINESNINNNNISNNQKGALGSESQNDQGYFQQQQQPYPPPNLSNNNNQNQKNDEDLSPETKSRLGQAGMVGAGLIFLAGKTKWLIATLKITKMSTMLSMLATTGAYAFIFGWPYAVGFVGLIFVHESGHALAMRYYGIESSPMVFIPFIGASVEMKDRPKDVEQEAMIALAGPALGSLAALGVGVAGLATQSQLLIALADAGLIINAFNLLPIGQLDGGRIAGAVSKYALVGGLGMGGMLILNGTIHNPLFYLIMLMAGFSTYERFFGGEALDPSYYRIKPGRRILIGGSYIGLIAAIIASIGFLQLYRKSPKQLREEAAAKKKEEAIKNGEAFSHNWAQEQETSFERFARQLEHDGDSSKEEIFVDPWNNGNNNSNNNSKNQSRWA